MSAMFYWTDSHQPVVLTISGVRLDRVRGGRQKYKRSSDGSLSYAVVSQSLPVKRAFSLPYNNNGYL